MQLTILMPCLNEAETLATCIEKAQQWIARCSISAEVVIADNGSTDGSQAIAESLGARVVPVAARGYGAALYSGAHAAAGQWIIMGDSDDSYDFSNLDPFVDKLREGFDLVMGNRFAGGIADGAMPWKSRYIGNPALTKVGRILFSSHIGDFHCGLRGFTKRAFLNMDLRTSGMEFASEMVIKATLQKMRIAEVPTTLSPDGRSRAPHLRPWRDGWRHLRFMLLFCPRWLFIIPGAGLSVLSLIAYGLLLRGPVTLGGVEFDIHTLFFVQAALSLGYLSLVLGLAIKLFGIREGLLPGQDLLGRLRASPALEAGSVAGLALIAAGLWWGWSAVLTWNEAGFGSLAAGELLRTISLSTTSILIGGITLLASLITGFVSLPTRAER